MNGRTRAIVTKREWRRIHPKFPEIRGDIVVEDDDGDDVLGPQRTATFVVAASDSNEPDLDVADYVCSGTDDQDTIQEAIDALPALISDPDSLGGQVLLMEGTFSVTGGFGVNAGLAEILDGFPGITVSGQGPSTRIKVADGTNASFEVISLGFAGNAYHFTVKNLALDGNKANQSSGSIDGVLHGGAQRCGLENVTAENFSNRGFALSGHASVKGCRAANNDSYGFKFLDGGGDSATLEDCWSHDNGDSGLYASGTGGSHHIVSDFHSYGNANYGIEWYAPDGIFGELSVHSNDGVGMWIESQNGTVSGGSFQENAKEGLVVGMDDGIVSGATVAANGTLTSNTYANLRVKDGSYSELVGNLFRLRNFSNPGDAKYAILVDAAATGTFIIANDCHSGGTTGDIQDNGVGTVIGPNRDSTGLMGSPPPHNILSTAHGDTDATDTPSLGDVLTWNGTKWDAEAPTGGSGTGSKTFAFFS